MGLRPGSLAFYAVLSPAVRILVFKVAGKEDDSFISTHFTLVSVRKHTEFISVYFLLMKRDKPHSRIALLSLS